MKSAMLNIRTTPETKRAIEELYGSFGITVSDAVNIFFNKSIIENGLPFEMKMPRYNEKTEKAIAEAREMRGKGGGFTDIDELFKELKG
ncbi:MAG: type II toxin-antitoxin system RelB/DinJ family antitoxin [Firmicutes bacterium]|nr:type II toxin-antitoxin system RelB/DinJ family antitoxin [Bacillota bacterium]